MSMQKMKPALSGLSNIGFGLILLGIAAPKFVGKTHISPNGWFLLACTTVVMLMGLYLFFITGKGKLEQQTSMGWVYYFFGFATIAGVLIGSSIWFKEFLIVPTIIWGLAALLFIFLGIHTWPK